MVWDTPSSLGSLDADHNETPTQTSQVEESVYRPSSASTYTSSSSDAIFGPRQLPPSLSPLQEPTTLISPTASEELAYNAYYDVTFPSTPTEALEYSPVIPSAQPYTPDVPLYSPSFSHPDSPSFLPSPPSSSSPQPYEDPGCALAQLRFQSHTYTTDPLSRHTHSHNLSPHNQNPPPRTPSPDDLELLSSVLDGIGRMYVTVSMDDAGRWRICRVADSTSEYM